MKKKCKNIKKRFLERFLSFKKRMGIIITDIILFFKEKGKLKKIKKIIKYLKKLILKRSVIWIMLAIIPFIIMDIYMGITALEVEFFPLFTLSPRLFSVAYIILIIGVSFNLKEKKGYVFYILAFMLFYILFLVNSIYYSVTGNFFSLSLISLAHEGSTYFLDAIKSCDWFIYFLSAIVLLIFLLSLKFFPNKKEHNIRGLNIIFLIFFIFHLISKIYLGSPNFELTWDTWRNPRNVYDNFNDSNKCMTISGFFEYSMRDFYVTYIKPLPKKNDMESKFLEDVFSDDNNSFSKNKYTGIFKNKNVIFLQFEGIDDWLLTNEIMPNTYKLLNNSISFNNHYSFYNGGGSTFNSEFAVNVGYMTPYTYLMNAYTLNKNDFPYSMANLMKTNNYSIKAFHMNEGEYYSRSINYSNWGYDRYYGLKDLGDYNDTSYYLDRELILNETFYQEIFKNEGKFVNYIITYSNHMPFGKKSGVCKRLLNLDYEKKIANMDKDEKADFFDELDYSEEDCIKRQAKETDYFVKLLMKGLKDNGLYDNTIIVAFTDHYLYTLTDQTILEKYKDTETNLINKTPFFIWSSKQKKMVVTKVTSQLNILPTFLNLMGINYNEKWYVSTDALDSSYQSLSIFSDLSWYDGNVYVVDGLVENKKKITNENLEKKNNLVEYMIKKNDLVLKYNYFKDITN